VATTLFLVRHAVHALLGRVLTGRMDHVNLDREGREQARRLAKRLAHEGVTLVQSSPRERARQTAEAIAEQSCAPVEVVPEIDEVDVGEWTGRRMTELETDSRWLVWNSERDAARAPGGESIADVRARVWAHLLALPTRHPGGRIALVSHAEIIRTVVLHCLGLPFSAFGMVEIGPASVTTLVMDAFGPKIIAVNKAADA